jgi:predicted nucleotidyltransferase
MTPEQKAALNDFAEVVAERYGSRLDGIYVFGSRARDDHGEDSDVDVAIVLRDIEWSFWDEMLRLVDLSYDALIETGLDIQPWPIADSHWRQPSLHQNPNLVEAAKRDARPISQAA